MIEKPEALKKLHEEKGDIVTQLEVNQATVVKPLQDRLMEINKQLVAFLNKNDNPKENKN